MIQTQIFNTPTGQTYRPADRIERSLARTGNILEKGIREQYDRDMEQQQQFMSLYSNIGEIEGVLQQQYAGINQQMVDSTKQFMAEHYKKGGQPNDPEFRMKLGEMTGRLKGGMAHAENNIKQLRPFAEMLKQSPYINEADKAKAMTEVMALATNPDFLISRDPVDFMSIGKKYERPELILKSEADSFKTNGSVESIGMDAKGNQISTKILMNDFINRDQPLDEAGRLNTVVPPEYLQKALNGDIRPEVLEQYEKVRKQNYANLPNDVGMGLAIQESLRNSMTGNVTVSVKETAEEIRRKRGLESRQNAATDLAIRREQRMAGKLDEQDEFNDRYQRFVSSVQSNDKTFLGSYDNINPNVKDFKYMTVLGGEPVSDSQLSEIKSNISSFETWKGLGRDKRKELIEFIAGEEPSWYRDTDTEAMYQKVRDAFDSKEVKPIVVYQQKDGTSAGSTNWTPRVLPLGSQEEVDYAFQTLENLRLSGVKPKTEARVPEKKNDPKDLTDIFK